MDLTHEYTHDIGHRFKYLIWIVTAAFLVIAGRLYYLQVVKGAYYRFFAEQNSVKEMKIPAVRGNIYDRNGVSIVENRAAFDVVAVPQYIKNKPKFVATLSNILNLNKEDIEDALQKGRNLPKYFPIIIKQDAAHEEISVIRAFKTPWPDDSDQFDLRGADIQLRYAREYKDGEAESHLLGYLKEIDPDRLKEYEKKGIRGYEPGDFVGVLGVEEVWDASIRGKDGFDQKVVNAIGREVLWPDIELMHVAPANGASLQLTIDSNLQKVAKEELAGKSGALVAIEPASGEILAIYSSPSPDLNRLSSSTGGKYWQQLALDPDKPLYNRAIQGTYPPASTFKIVTGMAALAEGIIKPDGKLPCAGGLHYGGRFYQCWNKGGHGSIDIKTALASSCDTFFYQLGLKLGVDKIAKYANLLGLGKPTGLDIPGEKRGLIPTSAWKEKRFGQPWQSGENISVAIGQGYDSVTPLQNAVMIAAIANGGRKIKPHIALGITGADGSEIYKWRGGEEDAEAIPPEMVNVIKEGLKNVVNEPGGTAHALKALDLKIAGKTGTAQVIGKEAWRSGVEKLKDHAWFVGYAPYDAPKIAVAAIVEHGGFGASAAAPIVGKIIKEYLKK